MKTLVTGGTGFIGSHLVEYLRNRGDEVRCVAKDALNMKVLESLNVEVVLGDLNNGIGWETVLDGIECVYHLAGVTRARSCKDYYEGNFMATKRFVEVCSIHCTHLQRFVHVSSQAAAGPSLNGEPVTETTPLHPVSHYGKSKLMGEREVLKISDRLPVTIIRPSAVYGPRERDMYEYIRIMTRGIQPLIGFDRKLLSLIHTDDLVEGTVLAAEHPRAIGETYFLSSEGSYTTEEIGQAIARTTATCPIRVRIPHAVVYGVGAIAEAIARLTGTQIFFNMQKARESVQEAWICSVEKARTHFGFRQRVSLEEGMAQTYRWYKENGWL